MFRGWLLYVKRWLSAPLALPDGTLQQRDGAPRKGPRSRRWLANLFMHYAFDMWMAREYPGVAFERMPMTRSCTASPSASRNLVAAIGTGWSRSGCG